MGKLLLAVVCLAAVTAGCSDDDTASPSASTETSTETSTPTFTSAVPGPPIAGSGPVEVTASDFTFEGVPEDLVPGERTFVLQNEGDHPHEMAIGRLLDDTPLAEIAPAGVANVDPGSRRIIAAVEPGGTGEITLELDSGRYGYVCWLRDGTDTERHAERGMIGEFTVE